MRFIKNNIRWFILIGFFMVLSGQSKTVLLNNCAVSSASNPCKDLSLGTVYDLLQTAPNEIYVFDGATKPWKGGDTVRITGTSYSGGIQFFGIKGDACRPLVIIAATGFTASVVRFKEDCRYIKFVGTGTMFNQNITVNSTVAIERSHHIEINNVEITGGSIGIYCKTDPYYGYPLTYSTAYKMTGCKFRNLWIHDIDGEGMYIGHSQPDGETVSKPGGGDTVLLPIRLDSTEITNCVVESTQWDGIQLSNSGIGNIIAFNTVRNYGLLNLGSQQAGIILGGNTQGDVYNNTVYRGTGNAIELFGFGVINAYGNLVDSAGYDGTANGQHSVYTNDYVISSDVRPKQQIRWFNNAINHPPLRGALDVNNDNNNSLPAYVVNNIFCISGANPVTWAAAYINIEQSGSTNTNNTLRCP